MNKKIVVILAIVAVGVVAFLAVLLFQNPAKNPSPAPNNGFDIDIGTKVPVVNVPKSDSIILNTAKGQVKVNNFIKAAKLIVNPSVYVENNSDYAIVYSQSTQDFLLDLFARNAGEAVTIRAEAEAKFLSALGISESDACKLPVLVEIPFSYSEELSGKNYGLSFCPNSIKKF